MRSSRVTFKRKDGSRASFVARPSLSFYVVIFRGDEEGYMTHSFATKRAAVTYAKRTSKWAGVPHLRPLIKYGRQSTGFREVRW